jgi:carbon monoxide dehydrogenase subunit G
LVGRPRLAGDADAARGAATIAVLVEVVDDRSDRAMKIEGTHDIPAPRAAVWKAFLDPEILRQAIPGCERLDAIGEDEYRATMKIGVAAVKGTFEGKVKLHDKAPPESYRLAVDGSGGPGFVRGDTLITLSDIEGGTRVSYSADVQVGGLIAGVGQRLLGGVSKMMADKFFSAMGELLQPRA